MAQGAQGNVMIRPSLHGVSFFCGLAGKLSEESGVERAAVMGKAFHAQLAGELDALNPLTVEERAAVEVWAVPLPVATAFGTLVYPCSNHTAEDPVLPVIERRIAIETGGAACDEEDPFLLTVGTPDMVWVLHTDEGKIAYVGDVKKTDWTAPEGPESQQLHSYGWMSAANYDCVGYCTGIWAATEAEWSWLDRVVMLDSDEGRAAFGRLSHAALNESERGTTGSHCRSCYGRMRCPEYLLPSALSETRLKIFTEGHEGAKFTEEELVTTLLSAQGMAELAKLAIDNVKEAVRRGAVVTNNGKRFLPVVCKGRESVDLRRLKEELNEEVQPFLRRGAPFEQWRWMKGKT